MKRCSSLHVLALGIDVLKHHAAAFAPLQEEKVSHRKRAALAAVLAPWYHAGAFTKERAPKGGGGGGGGRGGAAVIRFSPQEEKWLQEAYKKYGQGGKSAGGNGKPGRPSESTWLEKALEKYSFHPTRTVQALRIKWNKMNK